MPTPNDRRRCDRLTAAAAALVACLALLIAAGAAFAGEAKPAKSKAAEKVIPDPLRRVETKKVCMVNDQVFPRDQIPVLVEGRTYYGCCTMCKERLIKDVETRSSVDPVSGKKIDKATAVIAAREDGSVIYFESEKNFTKYLEEVKKHQ